MRKDIIEKKQEIINWVNENQSKAFIYKQLKCKPETLNYHLKQFGIEYKGNQGLKGKKTDKKRKSAKEYIKQTLVRSFVLKKKLIEEGYKKNKCDNCGLSEWKGVDLSLELHHKDGDRFNNDFDNLQILCPNCHSITSNFRGRKVKEKKIIVKKDNIIIKKKKSYLPRYHKRKVIRPSYKQLIFEIKELGYLGTGRKYGVSDNAIRKWVKSYMKIK